MIVLTILIIVFGWVTTYCLMRNLEKRIADLEKINDAQDYTTSVLNSKVIQLPEKVKTLEQNCKILEAHNVDLIMKFNDLKRGINNIPKKKIVVKKKK